MAVAMMSLCGDQLSRWRPSAFTLPIVAILLFSSFLVAPASADYAQAKVHFDTFDADTKFATGLGLIATGDFDGLLDFGFTRRFYRAITAFQWREGFTPDGELDTGEVARLKERTAQFYSSLGLRYYKHPEAASQLLVPRLAFDTEKRASHGFAFERNDENLSLSFVAYPEAEKTFAQLYDSLTQNTAKRQVEYRKLGNTFFVSNGTYKARHYYTWISAVQGGSTGFTLTWSTGWGDLGSKLSILLANSFVPAGTTTDVTLPEIQPDQQGATNAKPEDAPQSGTGTGFKVSYEGHVLTNFHVAGRCQKILLRKPGAVPVAAELVGGDETNDLALVRAQQYLGGPVASFSSGLLPRAGSEIAVYGFPLAGALSTSGNIVTGNITALAGLGNDSRLFQISAPVQPGNSGGPVMDLHGSVIAVVVSKLNAIEVAKITGDIPQNVNFAIKANVATNFLEGIGIKFRKVDSSDMLDTPTIAERAQGFTFLIECQN